MSGLRVLAILIIALVAISNADILADRVRTVPGLKGTLGLQFSGYINVNETHGRYLHYWLVTAAGPNALQKPLVLWLNGGPGCSSLDGFLYENGPWNWSKGFNDTSLIDSPTSWHLHANMLYLESPAGVGFSYSNTPGDYGQSSDTQTAEDAFIFLKKFFNAYPEYAATEFFIAGESYGGIYVPTLANRVVKGNLAGESKINIKGIAVGNGVTDPRASADNNNLLPFMYGHALYSTQQQVLVDKYCGPNGDENKCDTIKNQIFSVFDNLDVYNIIGDCYHQRPATLKGSKNPHLIDFRAQMDVPCTDSHKADIWLNQPAVKQAINVKQDLTWSICSEEINGDYNHDIESMIPIYHFLIQNSVRVLIFSGDVDASVPFTGTQYWTSQLMNLPLKSLWQPWTVNNQIAGFITRYQGLDFLTVKGAGHMVPQFKPKEAFVMIQKFLNNLPY